MKVQMLYRILSYGYKADYLEFGSYAKDNFAVLFVDMRNSTKRAETLGEEKTFLSMHAYIPALLQVIEHYDGKVVDIMGDGIMVFLEDVHLRCQKNCC